MSGGGGVGEGNDGRGLNGEWNRLVDRKGGLAPTSNTTTSAWTFDDDDVIPSKGIRVQKDLEQIVQRGLGPGMAV